MPAICPNKSSAEWKYLVDRLGEKDAYRFFIANNNVLPSMQVLAEMYGDMPSWWNPPVAELSDPWNTAFEMKKNRFGPVKKLKDLNEYFKNNTASLKSFDQYSNEEFASGLLSTIRNNGGKFNYAGKDYDFSISTDDEVKTTIIKDIMPDMKAFESTLKQKLVGWMNDGHQISELPTIFPGKKHGLSRFSDNVMMALVQRYIGNNTSTKYFLYSDIKNDKELQKLGIPYDEIFEGYDPIIALHESPEGTTDISIFDITSFGLNDKGLNPEGNNLFANFGYTDSSAYLNQISFKNSEAGIRQFYLALLTMKMRHISNKIKFKDIAILGLRYDSIDPRYVIMQSDVIPSVRAIRTIQPFMDLIPEELKVVINNKNLDKDKFDQPILNSYRAFLKTQHENKLKLYDGNEAYVIYEKEAVSMVDAYKMGMASPQEFVDMLKNRMHMLQNQVQDKGGVYDNEEYKMVSEVLASVRYGSLERNTTKDTSYLGHLFKNLFDVSSDLVQWARNEIGIALNYIQDKLFSFKKEHDVQLTKLSDALKGSGVWDVISPTKERVLDIGGDRFKRLFKKRQAIDDKTKSSVEITVNEIHFNENDPETRKAISNGSITKAEVAYGKWIVEQIKEMYIDLIMHENRFVDRMQKLPEDQRRIKAEQRYNSEWKDGLIPVVKKSFSEKIATLEGKGGIKQFWKEMANTDMLYHDQEYGKQEMANVEVFNGFYTELGSSGIGSHKTYLGSSQRLEKMGLAYDATGGLSLINMDENKNVSTNLENIMDYFMMMGYRKMKMDTDVLPIVNAARTLLFMRQKAGDQKNNLASLNVMVDRLVHGKKGSDDPLGIDVDPIVNTALAVASFNGLAYNVPVWAASFLMNQSQAWTFAISNGLAKSSKFFTQKEAAEAMQKITTSTREFNKMLAIMKYYHVADMSERDLTSHPRHKKFGKQLWKSHYAHIGGWATDYTARGWVMMSQMIHDGSWDAHTVDEAGNVTYDVKKDKRFYQNGKPTADGQILMDAIKQKGLEDGWQEDLSKPLQRGYNYHYAKQFKYIADKYVIGGMDPTTYGAIESVFWGRMLVQFKRYLPAKFMNAFGRPIESTTAVYPEIVVDAETGERVVRWNGNIVEGYFQTFWRIAKDLKKVRELGLKEYWQTMKPEERYNMMKMAMDLAMFSILYTLYAGLTADWDDDQEEDILKDSRMLRVFKYSAMDLMPFAPWNILKAIDNPMPVVDQSLRLFNMVTGDTRQWEKAVPGSTTYQVIDETFGLSEE